MPTRRHELATSEDVARIAGVSRATVSNFLNRSKYVSPQLSNRVKSAIQRLDYRPHGIARSLAVKKTYTIGLLVPRITSSFYPPIVSAVQRVLERAGYSTILVESLEKQAGEATMFRVLTEKRVDGIIWAPCSSQNLPLAQSLVASGFPVVIIDRRLSTRELDMVVSDNEGAGRTGTRYLLSLGYRRILALTFSQDLAPARDRLTGYRRAMQEAGIGVERSLVCIAGKPAYGDASKKLAAILRGTRRPEAIFACSDVLTLITVKEARHAGLSIPRDLAVLGFDDTHWGPFVDPPLTVMTQDTQNMGTLAARFLLHRLNEGRDEKPHLIELPVKLLKRSSCGEGKAD